MVKISLTPEQRLKFFVYIVESPSAPDMYHGRFEGSMIQTALSLDMIRSAHRITVSEEAFRAAILLGLLEEQMKAFKDLIPIIHISAHGSCDGLQLTSKEIISWDALKQLLLPINQALNGNLILCMSSCEGVSACRMAMSKEGDLPFFAVVGHSGKPTWSDTAIGYAAFYHLIAKGCYVLDAVHAMKEASGDDGFNLILASEIQKEFLKGETKKQIEELQKVLASQQQKAPLSEKAISLEQSL